MTMRPFVKKNLSLAWPLALNALLMQSMLLIDTLLVSPLGEISVAALGISMTIMAFVFGIQAALANGAQLIIGRAYGTGNLASLLRAFISGVIINLTFSLITWAILLLFKQYIVACLATETELLIQVDSYLSVSSHILILSGVTQACIAFFNGKGKTSVPLKGYLLEMPINALSSYLFIHGAFFLEPQGVQGAAWGSLAAVAIRMTYLCLYIRKEIPRIPPELLETDWLTSNLSRHLKEVFPIAINLVILSIGAMLYQLIYAQLPISSYAAIALVFPWIKIGTQFITAWAHSSAICISQAIGAGKFDTLQQDIRQSVRIAVYTSLVIAMLFLLLSQCIEMIYPELGSDTYLALTVIAPLYIFLPLIRGYNTVYGHVLRSLGQTTDAFKINFTGQWLVSLPLLAMLVFWFDISLFWAFAVQPFEELIKAIPFRMRTQRQLAKFKNKAFSQSLLEQ